MSRLTFSPEPAPKRRTGIWSVWAGETWLGDVAWYSHWRCYGYYPEERRVLDAECLAEIAAFCAEQTTARKGERRDEVAVLAVAAAAASSLPR